jgi:hypothetical protein
VVPHFQAVHNRLMTQHVLLDNVEHRALRVDTSHRRGLGDDVMMAVTFPDEFRQVQAHYPIVYRAVSRGTFVPMALFGLREGQNLFMDGGNWEAGYIPLSVARQPFLIGEDVEDRPVMYIDLDHPRVGMTQGEPLFLEHGGHTDFLKRANSMLRALHEGMQATAGFVDALVRLQLLEPFVLDIPRGGSDRLRVSGLSAIHEEKLRDLDGDSLNQLHRQGYLQAIYMCLASMSHIQELVDRLNRHECA